MLAAESEPFVSRFLYDRAPVLFFEFGDGGVILDANRHAAALLGGDIVGKSAREVFLDFTQALDLPALAERPDEEHMLGVAIPGRRPETWRFSLAHHGEHILACGRMDMAGKELLEQQILSLNAELSNLTRDLQQANAELARLNRLKDQFLGMAAHDLRKPVGLIMSYSDFLIDEAAPSLSEEQRGFLTTIQTAASTMRRLIDDFLDVSVIESGHLRLDLAPTDIPEVVSASVRLVQIPARKRNVTLDVQHGAALPLVAMDGPKLEQVLTNLLSNAVEHSAAGRTVTLATGMDEEALWITVRDEGPGMPPEVLRGLFAPFGSGRTPKPFGERSIGLGLAIARKIVDEHRGRIQVVSQVGVGSEFRVRLPLDPLPKGQGS